MADTVGSLAPQWAADQILIPCAIGWGLQLLLCGVATTRACPLIKRRSSRPCGVPHARLLLCIAVLSNLLAAACTQWQMTVYITSQDRSLEALNAFQLPDCLVSLPAVLAGAATQIFMAVRCWRVSEGSRLFAALIVPGITAVLTGGTWSVGSNVMYMQGQVSSKGTFPSSQIWMWANVYVDFIITCVLVYHLMRRKTNASSRSSRNAASQGSQNSRATAASCRSLASDDMLNALIRLAFETCAAPLLVSLATAVTFAATAKTPFMWNANNATLPFIPSLYVLSFTYCLEASIRAVSSASSRRAAASGPEDEESGPRHAGLRDEPKLPHCVSGPSSFGSDSEQTHSRQRTIADALAVRFPWIRYSSSASAREDPAQRRRERQTKDTCSSDWEAPNDWQTAQSLHLCWSSQEPVSVSPSLVDVPLPHLMLPPAPMPKLKICQIEKRVEVVREEHYVV